jgi:hypothetical protein
MMIGKYCLVFCRPGHTVFSSIAPLFVSEGWEWDVDAEEVWDVTLAVGVVRVDIDAFEARCRLGSGGESASSGLSRTPRGDGNTQRDFND